MNLSSCVLGRRFQICTHRLIVSIGVAITTVLTAAPAAFADAQSYMTADDLAGLKDIGGSPDGAFSVSPDQKWIVFQLQSPDIAASNYKLEWKSMRSSGGAGPRMITDGGEIILNPHKDISTNGSRPQAEAKWSPDSKRFAYLLKRNGETQIWSSRPDRRGQKQLTFGPRDVTTFSWSRDGKKIFYKTGADISHYKDLYNEEKKSGLLYNHRFNFGIQMRSLPQRKLCDRVTFHGSTSLGGLANFEYDCDQRLWVFDIDSKSERLATEKEKSAYAAEQAIALPGQIGEGRPAEGVIRWGESSRYAWLENIDPDIYAGFSPPLRIYASMGGKVYTCEADECVRGRYIGASDFWWSAGGEELFFTRSDGWNESATGIYAWAPMTGELRVIYQSEESWLTECQPIGERFACLFETVTSPRKLVSISSDDGSMQALYDPNPSFSDFEFSPIEKLEWKDRFGNQTHGFLIYPRDYDPSQTYPMVFVTYRAKGFLRGGVGDEYPAHPLAANGLFVLVHDHPLDRSILAKEPDGLSSLMKDLYWRHTTLSSQETIIAKLAERKLIDADRVALTGLSEGAAQVFFAMMHSNKFAAFISSGGGADTVASFYMANSIVRPNKKKYLQGAPGDAGSYWDDIALDYNVDKVNAPLLMNVSDWEAAFAAPNVSLLQEAGKAVEMYIYLDEGHIKWRPDHRLSAYNRNIQWLNFWLKGEVDSEPVSEGQYDRWRTMRADHCAVMKREGKDLPSFCAAVVAE